MKISKVTDYAALRIFFESVNNYINHDTYTFNQNFTLKHARASIQ